MTRTTITAVLVALAVAAPAAQAKPMDPLGTSVSPAATQDLRSPDARDATVTTSSAVPVDLRTPDAVTGTGTGSPDVTVVEAPQPVSVDPGFDWADAGLGAGIALAIALLSMSAAYVVSRHRTAPLA